jgi:L-lactate dehydrogenase complex protein LldG
VSTESSREVILQRIRAALTVPERQTLHHDKATAATPSSPEQIIAKLIHRLEDYDARVFRSSPANAGWKIAVILTSSGKTRMLAPRGVPQDWIAPAGEQGVAWSIDEALSNNALSYEQIQTCDGVLTAATVVVAESGSIVLQHGPSEGRRVLTLLPDYHLCVIRTSQVVESLPECFARLQPTATALTTFISGPSATADIEMTRIKGVHGPRFLDVVLVEDSPQD